MSWWTALTYPGYCHQLYDTAFQTFFFLVYHYHSTNHVLPGIVTVNAFFQNIGLPGCYAAWQFGSLLTCWTAKQQYLGNLKFCSCCFYNLLWLDNRWVCICVTATTNWHLCICFINFFSTFEHIYNNYDSKIDIYNFYSLQKILKFLYVPAGNRLHTTIRKTLFYDIKLQSGSTNCVLPSHLCEWNFLHGRCQSDTVVQWALSTSYKGLQHKCQDHIRCASVPCSICTCFLVTGKQN